VQEFPSFFEAVFHVGAPLKAGRLSVNIEKVLNFFLVVEDLALERRPILEGSGGPGAAVCIVNELVKLHELLPYLSPALALGVLDSVLVARVCLYPRRVTSLLRV
jgi:hypothetical protein